MKTEENVYDETTRTEETMAVSEERASTVPEKFKDVDALVRAYGSLQAEFTRRSQRLKELERRVENFERGASGVPASGAEKLRKNALARKAETRQFDQFVAEATGIALSEPQENAPVQHPELQEQQPSMIGADGARIEENGGTMAEMNASEAADTAREGEGKGDGERVDLYEQVCRNEEVRLKIVGEYLTSLGRRSAPLMTGGTGLTVTPPQKPRSISEAGNMALLYFKKPKNN